METGCSGWPGVSCAARISAGQLHEDNSVTDGSGVSSKDRALQVDPARFEFAAMSALGLGSPQRTHGRSCCGWGCPQRTHCLFP